jgi:hypothetical protein
MFLNAVCQVRICKNVKNVVAVSELSVSRDEDMEMAMFF